MSGKKRGRPSLQDRLGRPWCYYCERDFDDLKILVNHQKAKHFRCDSCNRRLNTIGGLKVHMNQVHKEEIHSVENALPERQNITDEIFGMEGMPEKVLAGYQQRITEEYYTEEAEYRARTGNPLPGSVVQGEPGSKKIKTEDKEDLKARVARVKAEKEAAKLAAAGRNGSATPIPHDSPAPLHQGHPMSPQVHPHQSHMSPQVPPHQGHAMSPQVPPHQAYGMPPQSASPVGMQYPPTGYPPQQQPHAPMQQYGQAPAYPPYHLGGAYLDHAPQYPPAPMQYHQQSPFDGPYSASGGAYHGPPQPTGGYFAAGYSPSGPPYQSSSPHPTFTNRERPTPPQGQPPRQASLPSAPGLPLRPSFDAPNISRLQMQEIHVGRSNGQGQAGHTMGEAGPDQFADSVDALISDAQSSADAMQHDAKSVSTLPIEQPSSAQNGSSSHQASHISHPPDQHVDAGPSAAPKVDQHAEAGNSATPKPVQDNVSRSEAKKDTAATETPKVKKTTKYIYYDATVSPEEKMAKMARYAFKGKIRDRKVLAPVGAAVTGVARGSDDVMDASG